MNTMIVQVYGIAIGIVIRFEDDIGEKKTAVM